MPARVNSHHRRVALFLLILVVADHWLFDLTFWQAGVLAGLGGVIYEWWCT